MLQNDHLGQGSRHCPHPCLHLPPPRLMQMLSKEPCQGSPVPGVGLEDGRAAWEKNRLADLHRFGSLLGTARPHTVGGGVKMCLCVCMARHCASRRGPFAAPGSPFDRWWAPSTPPVGATGGQSHVGGIAAAALFFGRAVFGPGRRQQRYEHHKHHRQPNVYLGVVSERRRPAVLRAGQQVWGGLPVSLLLRHTHSFGANPPTHNLPHCLCICNWLVVQSLNDCLSAAIALTKATSTTCSCITATATRGCWW